MATSSGSIANKNNFVDREFPPEIVAKYASLPKDGDIIEVNPCFQCSGMSEIKKVGDIVRVRVYSARYGVYLSDMSDSKSVIPIPTLADIFSGKPGEIWSFRIMAEFIDSATIIPYCSHAHGNIIIKEGTKARIRHSSEFGPQTKVDGWIVKNQEQQAHYGFVIS